MSQFPNFLKQFLKLVSGFLQPGTLALYYGSQLCSDSFRTR